jgi:hypothetical protein
MTKQETERASADERELCKEGYSPQAGGLWIPRARREGSQGRPSGRNQVDFALLNCWTDGSGEENDERQIILITVVASSR